MDERDLFFSIYMIADERVRAFMRANAPHMFKPCECGCGTIGPGGMMEAIHPEDYRYDERA